MLGEYLEPILYLLYLNFDWTCAESARKKKIKKFSRVPKKWWRILFAEKKDNQKMFKQIFRLWIACSNNAWSKWRNPGSWSSDSEPIFILDSVINTL